jgi:hypothetical protein
VKVFVTVLVVTAVLVVLWAILYFRGTRGEK